MRCPLTAACRPKDVDGLGPSEQAQCLHVVEREHVLVPIGLDDLPPGGHNGERRGVSFKDVLDVVIRAVLGQGSKGYLRWSNLLTRMPPPVRLCRHSNRSTWTPHHKTHER